MTWTTGYYYLPRYKWVSNNQHGNRFKRVSQKKLNVANMSCECTDTAGLERLILLSHHLDVPVHYDFEDHTAYIEVMSAEAVRRV